MYKSADRFLPKYLRPDTVPQGDCVTYFGGRFMVYNNAHNLENLYGPLNYTE